MKLSPCILKILISILALYIISINVVDCKCRTDQKACSEDPVKCQSKKQWKDGTSDCSLDLDEKNKSEKKRDFLNERMLLDRQQFNADNDNEDKLTKKSNTNFFDRYKEKNQLNTLKTKTFINSENNKNQSDNPSISDSLNEGDESSDEFILNENFDGFDNKNSNLDFSLDNINHNLDSEDNDDSLSFLIDHHSLADDELNSAAIQLSLLMEAEQSSSLIEKYGKTVYNSEPFLTFSSNKVINELNPSSVTNVESVLPKSTNSIKKEDSLESSKLSSSFQNTISDLSSSFNSNLSIPNLTNTIPLESKIIQNSMITKELNEDFNNRSPKTLSFSLFSINSSSSFINPTVPSLFNTFTSSSLNANKSKVALKSDQNAINTKQKKLENMIKTDTSKDTLNLVLLKNNEQILKTESLKNKLQYNIQGIKKFKEDLNNLKPEISSTKISESIIKLNTEISEKILSLKLKSSNAQNDLLVTTQTVNNNSINKKNYSVSSTKKEKQQKVIIKPIVPVNHNVVENIVKTNENSYLVQPTPILPNEEFLENTLKARKIESLGADVLIDLSNVPTAKNYIYTKTVGSNYDDLNEYSPSFDDDQNFVEFKKKNLAKINLAPSSTHEYKYKAKKPTSQLNAESFLSRINKKEPTNFNDDSKIKSRTTLFGFAHFTTVIAGTEIVFSPNSLRNPSPFLLETDLIQPTLSSEYKLIENTQLNTLKSSEKNFSKTKLNFLKIIPTKTRQVLIKTKSRIINRLSFNSLSASNKLTNQVSSRNFELKINPSLALGLNKNLHTLNPQNINLFKNENLTEKNKGFQFSQKATPPLDLNVIKVKETDNSIPKETIHFNYVTKNRPSTTKKHSISVLSSQIKMLPVGIVSSMIGPKSINYNAITEYTTLVIGTYIQGTYAHLLQTTSNIKPIVPTASIITPQVTITSGFILPSQLNNIEKENVVNKKIENSSILPNINLSIKPAITVYTTQTYLSTFYKNNQPVFSTIKEVKSSVLNPKNLSPSINPTEKKINNQVFETQPLASSKILETSSKTHPLELTIYTTLIKDGKTTLSSSIATLFSSIEKLSTDDEVGEQDEEEQTIKPTLTATTTFYTTYTFFTTYFHNGTKMISSNLKTKTNVVNNESFLNSDASNIEIEPTKTKILSESLVTKKPDTLSNNLESSKLQARYIGNNVESQTIDDLKPESKIDIKSILNGLKVPITHYTTFTYYTTFFKSNSPSIATRTEIVSNVVIDTINIKPSTPSYFESTKSVDILNENLKKDIFLTSGSQLEPLKIDLSSSFGGRLEPAQTPKLEQLPKSSPQINVDNLNSDQKKQLLLLRPDLFRKKLQTVYTTYTSSKTNLINGSPTVETLYATITNIIEEGQNSNLQTIKNSADNIFQLPQTSSSSHHVILRSRSDAPSVTHVTTITYYTTFAQGNSLTTASRKETRSDIRPNLSLMKTLAGQRKPIIIRRTKSKMFNSQLVSATRAQPNAVRFTPSFVNNKPASEGLIARSVQQQQQFVNRAQQQSFIQQQNQLKQLAEFQKQQLAIQQQQQLQIQKHFDEIIKKQVKNENLKKNTSLNKIDFKNEKSKVVAENVTYINPEKNFSSNNSTKLNQTDYSNLLNPFVETVNHKLKIEEIKENLNLNLTLTKKNETTDEITTPKTIDLKLNETITTAINKTKELKENSFHNESSFEIKSEVDSKNKTSIHFLPVEKELKVNFQSETVSLVNNNSSYLVNEKLNIQVQNNTILEKNEKNLNQTILLKENIHFNDTNINTNDTNLINKIKLDQTNNTNSLNNITTETITSIPIIQNRKLLFAETNDFELASSQTQNNQSLEIKTHELSYELNKLDSGSSKLSLSGIDHDQNIKNSNNSSNGVNRFYYHETSENLDGKHSIINSTGMYEKDTKPNLSMFSKLNKSIENSMDVFQTNLQNELNSKLYQNSLHSSADVDNISLSSFINPEYMTFTMSKSLPSLSLNKNSDLTGLISIAKSTLKIEELTIIYTTEIYGSLINGIYTQSTKTASEIFTSSSSEMNNINSNSLSSNDLLVTKTFKDEIVSNTPVLNFSAIEENNSSKFSKNKEPESFNSAKILLESSMFSLSENNETSSTVSSTKYIDSSTFSTSFNYNQAIETKTQKNEKKSSPTSSFVFATGLISETNSTQINNGVTSVLYTQVIGTFFDGLYAHVGKVSVSVIQPTPTIQQDFSVTNQINDNLTKTEKYENSLLSSITKNELSESSKVDALSKDSALEIEKINLVLNYYSDDLTKHAEKINGEVKVPLKIIRSSELLKNKIETSKPNLMVYHLAKVYQTNIGNFEAQFTVSSSFSLPSFSLTTTNEVLSTKLNQDTFSDKDNEKNLISANLTPSSQFKPSIHFPRRSGGRKNFLPAKSSKSIIESSNTLDLPSNLIHINSNGLLNTRSNEKSSKYSDFDDEYSDNFEKVIDRSSNHDTEYLDIDYEHEKEAIASSSRNRPMAKHRPTRDENNNNGSNDFTEEEPNLAEMYRNNQNRANAPGFNGRGNMSLRNNVNNLAARTNRQNQRRFSNVFGDRSNTESNFNSYQTPNKQRTNPYQIDQFLNSSSQSQANSRSRSTTTTSTTPSVNVLPGRRRYRNRNGNQLSTTTSTTTTTSSPLRSQKQNRKKINSNQQITNQPRGGRLRQNTPQRESNEQNQYEKNKRRNGNNYFPNNLQSSTQLTNGRRKFTTTSSNIYSTRSNLPNNYFDANNYGHQNSFSNNNNRQIQPSLLSPDEFKGDSHSFIATTSLAKLPITITSLVPIIKTLPIKHGFKTSYATLTTTTYNSSIIRPDQYQTRLDPSNFANTLSIFTEYIDPLNPTKVTQVVITTTAVEEIKLIPIKIGFNTRTDTLTSVQVLTTLSTNYLSTNGFDNLLQTATAPPGFTIISTSYFTTITQLSSFVVSLVLHGKTLLSTLSTSVFIPSTIHTYKTVPIKPTASVSGSLLTTKLTITLTGDNGDLTQLVTAVTISPHQFLPSSVANQNIPVISVTESPNFFVIDKNNKQNIPGNFKFPDGDNIAGAESQSYPIFISPKIFAENQTKSLFLNESNLTLKNPFPLTNSMHSISFSRKKNADFLFKNITGFRNNFLSIAHANHTNPQLSNLKSIINVFKGNPILETQNSNNHLTRIGATRSRPTSNSDNKNQNKKRPNKKLADKFAAASLAATYKNTNKNKVAKLNSELKAIPTFQKRKLFQFVETNEREPKQFQPLNPQELNRLSLGLVDSDNVASTSFQENRKRQKLSNSPVVNNGFQRVNIRTTSAANPQVRRVSINPNFLASGLENIGNISPNESPNSRFQRLVNNALTSSSNAGVRRNPSGQNFPITNPLISDMNNFKPMSNEASLFTNPSFLNDLDTPRRQVNHLRPSYVNPNNFNTIDFINPANVERFSHNPGQSIPFQRVSRKPVQPKRNRVPSSQLFNGEPNFSSFLPTRSISPASISDPSFDFKSFNSYSYDTLNRVSLPENSANIPVIERIQPTSVLVETFLPTTSKRLVRVRKPNTKPSSVSLDNILNSSVSSPNRKKNIRNRQPVNAESTQGRGPALNGIYTDEENNYGNDNAIDVDEKLLTNVDIKPISSLANSETLKVDDLKDSSVLVSYQTTFTYLTTVIKGQHTLYTSRISTSLDSTTKSFDKEFSEQLKQSTLIKPTETLNLGTKTKGATTTIVNVQSQVAIDNYKPIPPSISSTPTVSILDQNHLHSTQVKFLEKPEIIIDADSNSLRKPTPKLSLEQIKAAAQVVKTEYRYIYTVYDSAHTRKSTRNEIVTNTLSKPLDFNTIEIDSSIDSNGYLRLGSANGELINLGKRVKSGSTTEVNLQLKTLAKLENFANQLVDYTKPSSSIEISSSEVEKLKSSTQSIPNLRTKSSNHVVSSKVSSSDVTQLTLQKSKLAVRIRKPIFSRVSGSNNRIVSSRISNSRLPISTSEIPSLETIKASSVSDLSGSFSKSADLVKSNIVESINSAIESTFNLAATPTPSLDSTLVLTDNNLPNTSLVSPTVTPTISSVSNINSSKRRVVTVRKPLPGFHRLRTRKPSSAVNTESVSETESSLSPSTTARFSMYSRFTIPHSSSVSSVLDSSSSSSLPQTTNSFRSFPRVRLTSRVIKTKTSSSLVSSTSLAVNESEDFTKSTTTNSLGQTIAIIVTKVPIVLGQETSYRVLSISSTIQPSSETANSELISSKFSKNSEINPSQSLASTIYSTSTHTLPFTIGSKTLYTTFEITNSKVDTVNVGESTLEAPSAGSSSNQVSNSINAIETPIKSTKASDVETRTMFTTFTYFTTFYQSGGASKIVSSENTMSNVITVPLEPSLSSSFSSEIASNSDSLLSSSFEKTNSFTSEESLSKSKISNIDSTPTVLESMSTPTLSTIAPILITEHSEKTETSTILNTVTYFATLYNGTKSTITPIEEIKTELLTLREPIKITRTIHPLLGGFLDKETAYPKVEANSQQPQNVFVRTYYTTYTNPVTLFESNGLTVSSTEEVVSNVVTFTLPGSKPTTDVYPTPTFSYGSSSSIGLNSILDSKKVLSSSGEATPILNNEKLLTLSKDSQSLKSSYVHQEASQLVPSISTLYRTHTLYTTMMLEGRPTMTSREQVTSSLVTIYVPQSQIDKNLMNSVSIVPKDPVMTMYTTYTFFTTKSPSEIVSSLSTATQYITVTSADHSNKSNEIIKSTPVLEKEFSSKTINSEINNSDEFSSIKTLSSSIDSEKPVISSSLNEISKDLTMSVNHTSKLPAIFDTNVEGKSTTVIDGSTVVFFTDFIFPSSSAENTDITSATETNNLAKGPAGDNINLIVDNTAPYEEHPHLPKEPSKEDSDLIFKPDQPETTLTPNSIKPGQVIDLSDILGSSSIGGSLSDTIKDIVQLIAANTNKLGNKKQPVNTTETTKDSSEKDFSVFLPDSPIFKDKVSSIFVEQPVLASVVPDSSFGLHQHQRPQIDNIVPSFVIPNLDSNSDNSKLETSFDIDLISNKPTASLDSSVLLKSTNQFQDNNQPLYTSGDSLRPVMFDTISEQPVSTKYMTSVESSTRTLILTTTKVYYTRDSPLTITSVLTTTIKPRTFVTTIIGSRTILGTAGDQTKTLDILDATQQMNNLQQTTTVTTTTLTFNSITTTVVRTLVLPTVPSIQPSKTQAANLPKVISTLLPPGSGSITPIGSQTKRKPYVPNFKGPGRQTTTLTPVNIKPKDARTRAPFKPKPVSVPPRFATPKPKPVSTTTTTTTTTTEKPIEKDQCRPACNTANKEICKDFNGIFKCDCRPGFAKKSGSNICEEIQTYGLLIRVTKIGDNSIANDEFEDESSPNVSWFKKQCKQNVDTAYRLSSIKDNYIGSDINWINQTINTDGIYVNLTLKLSQMEGVNESMLKEEFVKSLNDINSNIDRQRQQTTLSVPTVTPASVLEEDHLNAIDSVEKNKTESNIISYSNSTSLMKANFKMLASVEALTDIDECSSSELNDCVAGAVCINSVGSYRCACVDGFADLQPSLPGRVCSAELKNCDFCNNRGDCIRETNGNIVCRCAKRYLGRNCEINGFMLTIMLPVTVIFAIITFCCVAYCCRKYRKRNSYSKNYKNSVIFGDNNLSPNVSASTLDRKAMLETSSESSEHFRHVYDGPAALLPDLSGSTRRARSEHMMDIANLMPPGSRSQLAANMSNYGYASNMGVNGNATNSQQAAAVQQYAGGFGTIPPHIVIPRARHPNQNLDFNYSNEERMKSLDYKWDSLDKNIKEKLNKNSIDKNFKNDSIKTNLMIEKKLSEDTDYFKFIDKPFQNSIGKDSTKKRLYHRNSNKSIYQMTRKQKSESQWKTIDPISYENPKLFFSELNKSIGRKNSVDLNKISSYNSDEESSKEIKLPTNKYSSEYIRQNFYDSNSLKHNKKSISVLINSNLDLKKNQLPANQLCINDTLNRTFNTFKSSKSYDSYSKLNNKTDMIPKNKSRKYYLDNLGNKIMVKNTIEDFLKADNESIIGFDSNESELSHISNLSKNNFTFKSEWSRLPFYDENK